MQLSTLIPTLPTEQDIAVTRLVDDSRHVQAGDIFVFDQRLCAGVEKFVAAARAQGAAAIITNADLPDIIYHPAPNQVLGEWAKTQFPKQPQYVVGITGTNGKTSTAWFYQQLAQQCGKTAGSIGTLGVWHNDKLILETGYTSPTPLQLHEHLHNAAKAGVTHLALEVSSHALALNRADGVEFAAAGFTNLSQDHLDFHQTMDAYAAAKGRLFAELLPVESTAILPIQQPIVWPFAAAVKRNGGKVLTFGSGNAELVLALKDASANGLTFTLKLAETEQIITAPVLGEFQLQNLGAAIGLALASDLPLAEIIAALSNITAPPGRMELFTQTGEPTVVVDYAHTPDALEHALKSLRPLAKAKLSVVFGCGGDRDKTKRPQMGMIAADLADRIYVTDDNPRTEDAHMIRQEVIAAAADAVDIGDRGEAIAAAFAEASTDDIVLVAGKGHETGQIIGKEKLPFDDRAVVRQILTG